MSIKRRRGQPRVSLIIPVYNEKDRLLSGLSVVLSYFCKQRYRWELIIVDDGSQKPVLLGPALRKFPVSVYRLPTNMGKGAAIRLGVEKARGRVIVFSDVDFSVPIKELGPMLTHLSHRPMVIASRRLPASHIVVHQKVTRELSGRIFTALSNILCGAGVFDVTCGFKGYDYKTAKKLFAQSRINRWVFDTEIVFLARKFGIPVFEIPVAWTNKAGSKVRPFDSAGSLVDLLRIRWNDMKGLYAMRSL